MQNPRRYCKIFKLKIFGNKTFYGRIVCETKAASVIKVNK